MKNKTIKKTKNKNGCQRSGSNQSEWLGFLVALTFLSRWVRLDLQDHRSHHVSIHVV